jgi:hypothetical protein
MMNSTIASTSDKYAARLTVAKNTTPSNPSSIEIKSARETLTGSIPPQIFQQKKKHNGIVKSK